MALRTPAFLSCTVVSFCVVSCGKIGLDMLPEFEEKNKSTEFNSDTVDASQISSTDITDKKLQSSTAAVTPTPSPAENQATLPANGENEQSKNAAGDVLQGFNFTSSQAFGSLSSRHLEITYLSKVSANKTVISFADGSAALFDEDLGSTKELRFSEPFDKNATTRIALSEKCYWEISKESLSLNLLSQVSDSSSQLQSEFKKFKVQGDFDGVEALYLSETAAVLRAGKSLRIIRFKGANYSEQKISGKSSFESVVPEVLAAGLSVDAAMLWLATSDSLYELNGVGDVFQLKGPPKKIKLGLSSDQKPLKLAFAFDFTSGIASASFLNTKSGLLLNHANQIFPTWHSDVMPLAQKYCLSCHGDVAVGGFGESGHEASWVEQRKRIMARIASVDGAAPMPPTYAPNQPSEAEKLQMQRWLVQREIPNEKEKIAIDDDALMPDEQATRPVVSPEPPATGADLVLSALALQFGRLPSLENLEKTSGSIASFSKNDVHETVFFMKDGSSYVYNELSDTLSYLQPVIAPVAGALVFLFPGSKGWQVVGNKVENFAPVSQVNTPGPKKIQVLSSSLKDDSLLVLGATPSYIILKSTKGLHFVTKVNDSLILENLTSMPALVPLLPDLLAAGFAPNKEFLWAATLNKVFFFRISAEGFLNPIVREFDTGGYPFSKLAIGFDKDFSPVGRFALLAGSKLLLSGVKTAPRPALAWETDIRPIAEQFCLSCHGESGAGGFSRANEQSSWTGVKRTSIVARVFEQQSMPPPNTNASKQMTLEQREKIKNWLNSSENVSLSGVSVGNAAGTHNASPTPAVNASQDLVPGPTWTNVVKPLMETYCQSCHSSTYSEFKYLYDSRAAVINSLENKNMPRPGSPQAAAMTQAERESILVYLRGLR